MAPTGVALIGGGIFIKEQHLVSYTHAFHWPTR